MSIGVERKRRYAAAAFVTLLVLSVFWPSPIVSSNRLWIHADLDVDDLSFLGREHPSWDVVFWFLAGVLLLAIVQTAALPLQSPLPAMRGEGGRRPVERRSIAPRTLLALALGATLVVLIVIFADAAVLAWAEGVQSEWTRSVIRIINRFGGGMNPVLIVAFFLVAGWAYGERHWMSWALAMAIAGLTAGLAAQIVKHLVGRARPELWLGPLQYAPGSSTSFPSGHTVGAFALAGVLVFASRSMILRVVALILAAAVGLSRVLAFRHWLSDVTASAIIGMVCAWIASEVFVKRDMA